MNTNISMKQFPLRLLVGESADSPPIFFDQKVDDSENYRPPPIVFEIVRALASSPELGRSFSIKNRTIFFDQKSEWESTIRETIPDDYCMVFKCSPAIGCIILTVMIIIT